MASLNGGRQKLSPYRFGRLGVLLLHVMAPWAARAADTGVVHSFIDGLSVHLMSRPAVAAKAQPFVARLHARSVRNDAPWARVENASGDLRVPAEWDRYIDEQRRQGLSTMLILDYGHPRYDQGDKPLSSHAIAGFVRYASFVAEHFRGRVQFYEVWNEWDAATGKTTPGSAADYARLLKRVYPVIKRKDPDAVVLGGAITADGLRSSARHEWVRWLSGTSSWLTQLLAEDVLPYMDGLSVHPYNYYAQGAQGTPEAWLDWMQAIEAQLRSVHEGRDVPLFVTEMGWPTYAGRGGVSESMAAAYVARTAVLARSTSFIKGIWWYQLHDEVMDPGDKENNFGFLHADFTVKPAFTVLAALNENIDPHFWMRLPPAKSATRSAHTVQFGDRQPVGWVVWSEQPKRVQVQLRAGATVRIAPLGAAPMQALSCPSMGRPAAGCVSTLSVTEVPLLLIGLAGTLQLNDTEPLAAE